MLDDGELDRGLPSLASFGSFEPFFFASEDDLLVVDLDSADDGDDDDDDGDFEDDFDLESDLESDLDDFEDDDVVDVDVEAPSLGDD